MPLPPRKGHKLSESHRHAPEQEKRIANQTGGKTTRGSGNQGEKGDVRLRSVARIEAKCTKHRSFSVTADMIDKIEEAAALAGEVPAIAIDMIGDDPKSCYVIPKWAFEELIERCRS